MLERTEQGPLVSLIACTRAECARREPSLRFAGAEGGWTHLALSLCCCEHSTGTWCQPLLLLETLGTLDMLGTLGTLGTLETLETTVPAAAEWEWVGAATRTC